MEFVNTHVDFRSTLVNLYTPTPIISVRSGMNVKTGYAPMSAITCMRTAVMVPSASTAASRSVTCARPCVVATMCSTRVSVQRSGSL